MKKIFFMVIVSLILAFSVSALEMPSTDINVDSEEVQVDYTEDSAEITAEDIEVVATPEKVTATTAEGDEVVITEDKATVKKAEGEEVTVDKGKMTAKPVKISTGNEVVIKQGNMEMVKATPEKVKSMFTNQNINLGEVSMETQSVKITPGKVMAGGVEVDSTGKTMTVNTPSGNTIQITPGEGAVVIKDSGVEVKSAEISVEGGVVKAGGVQIKMPSEILDQEELLDLEEDMDIELEDGKPMYKYEKKEKKKFLGLFSVNVGQQISVDAQSGEKVNVKGPWWSFMAFD